MIIELSPVSYIALCGLVQDALQEKSDASPLLQRIARELTLAASDNESSAELSQDPKHVEALRRVGIAA